MLKQKTNVWALASWPLPLPRTPAVHRHRPPRTDGMDQVSRTQRGGPRATTQSPTAARPVYAQRSSPYKAERQSALAPPARFHCGPGPARESRRMAPPHERRANAHQTGNESNVIPHCTYGTRPSLGGHLPQNKKTHSAVRLDPLCVRSALGDAYATNSQQHGARARIALPAIPRPLCTRCLAKQAKHAMVHGRTEEES